MIEHTVEQGTPEWLALRLGIPTASEFHKIITPTGLLAKNDTSRGYAFKLVTEKLLNRTLDDLDHIDAVARGKELEPDAARAYGFQHDVELRTVGFITTGDGRIGASPDRLIVGQPAGIEIKCPGPAMHIGYLVDGFGTKYMPQVQGQMMVAELDWVDRWSFHPEMPGVLDRTPRDEAYIVKLRAALDEFCDMKDAMLEVVRAKGFFAARAALLPALDEAYADQAGRPPSGASAPRERGPRRFNTGYDPRVANAPMPFA